MQTFLPVPNFVESARVLDTKRLGKQRVEAMQILNVLRATRARAWMNHPAVRMWRHYEPALEQYLRAMVAEWIMRGYANSIPVVRYKDVEMPRWFGRRDFHRSHQSNLLRKDAKFYRPLFPRVPDNLPYLWPVQR